MPSRPEQLRLSPDERADLVAYLDGELPEAHTRHISTKLTQSATARREIEILQKTWELLDYLPRPPAPPELSERTVSRIRRLEVQSSAWEPVLASWSAQGARLVAYLIALGLSLGCGYAVTRWVWPDPTERVARDLTLAEHLDEYLEAGSFEFLNQLAASKEFGAKSP
jgi:anti-sigma factor RsiW